MQHPPLWAAPVASALDYTRRPSGAPRVCTKRAVLVRAHGTAAVGGRVPEAAATERPVCNARHSAPWATLERRGQPRRARGAARLQGAGLVFGLDQRQVAAAHGAFEEGGEHVQGEG